MLRLQPNCVGAIDLVLTKDSFINLDQDLLKVVKNSGQVESTVQVKITQKWIWIFWFYFLSLKIYKNFWPFAAGFMEISLSVLELWHFEKKCAKNKFLALVRKVDF